MARPGHTSRASTIAHAVEGLVHSITTLVDGLTTAAKDARVVVGAAKGVGRAAKGMKAAVKGKGNRKPRSAAARAAQAARMRAYWKKRKDKAS